VSRFFGRNVEIGIGKGKSVYKTISGLDISFKVEQSTKSDPNNAEITVKNLSDDSLANLTKRGNEIFLKVGYGDKADSLLFWGNDVEVETTKEGVTRSTKIKTRDTGEQLRSGKINKPLPPGSDLSETVKKLISGMDNVSVSPAELIKLFGQGITQLPSILNGHTKDLLDDTLGPAGYQWSVVNGEVKIAKKKNPTPDTQIILISASSGMIGSPSPSTSGVTVKCLLNPKLSPETFFSIKSEKINGVYRIVTATHEGNSRGGDFATTIEGEPI
jgi:hypothetical protein